MIPGTSTNFHKHLGTVFVNIPIVKNTNWGQTIILAVGYS